MFRIKGTSEWEQVRSVLFEGCRNNDREGLLL